MGCVCQPEVHPPTRPGDLAPLLAMTTNEQRAPRHFLRLVLHLRLRNTKNARLGHLRHFHQLLRAVCVAGRTAREGRTGHEILGTAMTCLGTEQVDDLEHILQPVHRLRHRNVERRDGHERLQHGFHGALRNPFLWPRRLCQAGRPPPCDVFVIHIEEHRSLPGVDERLRPTPCARSSSLSAMSKPTVRSEN